MTNDSVTGIISGDRRFPNRHQSMTPLATARQESAHPPPSRRRLTSCAVVPMNPPGPPQPGSQPNVEYRYASWPFFGLVILTGAGAGLAAGLLMKVLRATQHISFDYHSGSFLSGVAQASPMRLVIILALAGVLGGVVLYTFNRVSKTESKSISEAVWSDSGELPTVPTVMRAVLSIVLVGMGVALGREGAMKQAGAVLGSNLAVWKRLSKEQRRLLVACGAGAGMSAAYNVPLGGAIFAAEVLLGSLKLNVVLPALAASFTATGISWLLLSNKPTYKVPELELTVPLILWSVLLGPAAGFASAAYVRAIAWAHRHKPKGWHKIVLPIFIFAGLGAAATKFPQLLGNGKSLVQVTFASPLTLGLLLCLVFLRPLATTMSLRSGVPGGLFTPTLTFGALVGQLLGVLWNYVLPPAAPRTCAILGSGALLAAATQGPVSSVAFVLELTHSGQAIMVPLLIAVVGASLTAKTLELRSIYSARE